MCHEPGCLPCFVKWLNTLMETLTGYERDDQGLWWREEE